MAAWDVASSWRQRLMWPEVLRQADHSDCPLLCGQEVTHTAEHHQRPLHKWSIEFVWTFMFFSYGLYFITNSVTVYPSWHQTLSSVSHCESHSVEPTQCGNSLIHAHHEMLRQHHQLSQNWSCHESKAWLWHNTNFTKYSALLVYDEGKHWVMTLFSQIRHGWFAAGCLCDC